MSLRHCSYPRHRASALVLVFVAAIMAGLAAVPHAVLAADAGTQAPAAANTFLADKHKAAGLDCNACHIESQSKPPDTKVCLQCHGPYDKLAARTEKVEPNPHASHQGELECESCHHGHKASVDFCAKCHTFDFKVP